MHVIGIMAQDRNTERASVIDIRGPSPGSPLDRAFVESRVCGIDRETLPPWWWRGFKLENMAFVFCTTIIVCAISGHYFVDHRENTIV